MLWDIVTKVFKSERISWIKTWSRSCRKPQAKSIIITRRDSSAMTSRDTSWVAVYEKATHFTRSERQHTSTKDQTTTSVARDLSELNITAKGVPSQPLLTKENRNYTQKELLCEAHKNLLGIRSTYMSSFGKVRHALAASRWVLYIHWAISISVKAVSYWAYSSISKIIRS